MLLVCRGKDLAYKLQIGMYNGWHIRRSDNGSFPSGGQFELHRALDLGATAATNLTNLSTPSNLFGLLFIH